jgi:hypothetical protein
MSKWKSLLSSRRFLMAVAGLIAISLNTVLGMDESQVLAMAGIIVAWILGDSKRETV